MRTLAMVVGLLLFGDAAFAEEDCEVTSPSEDDVAACAAGTKDCTPLEAIAALPRMRAAASQVAKPGVARAGELGATTSAEVLRNRQRDTEARLEAALAALPGCQQAKLFAQHAALPAAIRRKLEDAQQAAYRLHCTEPDVLCLDTDGKRFHSQAAFSVPEGDKLTVRILSADPDDAQRYQVVLTVKHDLDSLAMPQSVSKQALDALRDRRPAPLEFSVVSSATSTVLGEKDVAIGFEVERRDAATAAFSHVHSGRVEVDHGSYYFEFGLGLPFVYHDVRKASAATQISESTDPRAAIAVLYFPWSRQKGRLSYLSSARRSFGLFAGTDFDFSTLQKDYHLGIAYSPIQGLGFAAGLSIVPVQFLADSSAMTTNGAITTSTHEVLRPFVGVFLTTDFLNTASQAKTALLAVGK